MLFEWERMKEDIVRSVCANGVPEESAREVVDGMRDVIEAWMIRVAYDAVERRDGYV